MSAGILALFLWLYGIKHKLPARFYGWAFLAVLSHAGAWLIFGGGGTLEDPSGDGIFTAYVRAKSQDGPLVLTAFPGAVFLGIILPYYLVARGRKG